MLISFLAFLLVLIKNDNAIAENQDSGNSSTVSELVDENYPNIRKDLLDNLRLNLQLPRGTGPYNDTDIKSPQKTQTENITYVEPNFDLSFRKAQHFKRNVRNVHPGSRQAGRRNYRRTQSSKQGPRNKRRMYRDRRRTVSPSNSRNRKLYPRYTTDYGYAPRKHYRKNVRYIDNKRARRLTGVRKDGFHRRQMYGQNGNQESENTENARNNNIVSAKNNSKGKKNLKRKSAKTSKQKKTSRRNLQNNLKPQMSNKSRKSNIKHSSRANKNEENSKINTTQILNGNNAEKQTLRNQTRKQKEESRNIMNSKHTQSGDQKLAHVSVEKDLNKKRKEEKELKSIIEKSIGTSNRTGVSMQNKKEKEKSIINPKQSNKTGGNDKRKSFQNTSAEKDGKRNENKTSKQKKKSDNTKANKNILTSVNAKKDPDISIKQKEDEELKGAVNKTIDISNVNKPASQSEKDESVTELKENGSNINETRESKKEEALEDTKDTKNRDKTSTQKKKADNASASKSKSDKNEGHVSATVNVGKSSSVLIKQKEDKQLKSTINKTKKEKNEDITKLKQNSAKINETREGKTEETLKDTKDTKNRDKIPKQKKKGYNISASKSDKNEGHISTSVNVGKNSSISTRRKEDKQLKDTINKTIDILNVNKTTMQNKSEKDEGVIKPMQNSAKVNETGEGKEEKIPKDSKNTKRTNKTPKQKKKSYNRSASKRKSSRNESHVSASVNVEKNSNKPIKGKENEQLKGAVNKTIDISNINKTAVQSKSEKDESVIKLKQYSAKVNQTREDKKRENPKDSKNTRNTNKTPEQKKENYNASANKGKSSSNESHVSASVNIGKHSSIPIKGKENEQLKGAVNKTIDISNINKTVVQSKNENEEGIIKLKQNSAKVNETRESKKEETLKDSENKNKSNKTPKQKRKGYNTSASKRKSSRDENLVTTSMNVVKESVIPIKRKEDEQLKGAVNKTINILNVNKTAVQSKSEKDESASKPKQNSAKVNKTREHKKQETPKDSKNTKSTSKTPKQKKKIYNASASRGKSNRNESHVSASVNVGKNSSKRKENEQLKGAVNKTIDITNVNRTVVQSKNKKDEGVKLKQNSAKVNETRGGTKKETLKDSKNKNKSNETAKQKKMSYNASASKSKSSRNKNHVSTSVNVGKESSIPMKQKEDKQLKGAVDKTIDISNINKTATQSKKDESVVKLKQNNAKIHDARGGKKDKTLKHSKDTKNRNKAPKQRKNGDNTKAAKSKGVQKDDHVIVRASVRNNLGKPTKQKEDEKNRSKTVVQSKSKQDNGKIKKSRDGKKNQTLKGSNTKKDTTDKNNTPKQKKISHNVRSSKNKHVQNDLLSSPRANVKKDSKFRKQKEREELKSRGKQVSEGSQPKIQNDKENKKTAITGKQSKGNVVKGHKKEPKTPKYNKAIKSMLSSKKGNSKNNKNFRKKNSGKVKNKMSENGQSAGRNGFNKTNSLIVTKNVNTTLNNASARVLNSTNRSHDGIVNETRSGNLNDQTHFKSTNITNLNYNRTANVATNINNSFGLYVATNNTNDRNPIPERKNPLSNSTQFWKNQAQQHKQIQNKTSNSSNDNRHNPVIRRENERTKSDCNIKHDRELKARNRNAIRNYNASNKNYSSPYKPTRSNEVSDDTNFRFPTRLKLRGEKYFGQGDNNAKRYRNEFGKKHKKPIIKVSNKNGNINDLRKGKDHKSPGKNGTITISRRIHNISVSHSTTKDIQNVSAESPANEFKNQLLQRKPFDNFQYQKPTVIKFKNVTEYNTTDISQTHSLNNGKLQRFNEKIVKTIHKSYILTEVSSTDEILPDDFQNLIDPEFLE